MSKLEAKLNELLITLPKSPPVAGDYVPVVRTGDLLYVSGQLPSRDGEIVFVGKVGGPVEVAQAAEAARLAVTNALAAIKAELGSLDRVERIVRLEVFVNSSAGFTGQAQVANGASGLLVELFGPAGRHSRFAVGVAELPLDAAVELSLIVEVR